MHVKPLYKPNSCSGRCPQVEFGIRCLHPRVAGWVQGAAHLTSLTNFTLEACLREWASGNVKPSVTFPCLKHFTLRMKSNSKKPYKPWPCSILSSFLTPAPQQGLKGTFFPLTLSYSWWPNSFLGWGTGLPLAQEGFSFPSHGQTPQPIMPFWSSNSHPVLRSYANKLTTLPLQPLLPPPTPALEKVVVKVTFQTLHTEHSWVVLRKELWGTGWMSTTTSDLLAWVSIFRVQFHGRLLDFWTPG